MWPFSNSGHDQTGCISLSAKFGRLWLGFLFLSRKLTLLYILINFPKKVSALWTNPGTLSLLLNLECVNAQWIVTFLAKKYHTWILNFLGGLIIKLWDRHWVVGIASGGLDSRGRGDDIFTFVKMYTTFLRNKMGFQYPCVELPQVNF